MSREIPLTQGKFAIVDDQDFDWLSKWKWQAVKGKVGNFYARRSVKERGKKKWYRIAMHRLIVNAPDDMEVDHIDRNGLNNQSYNLRLASHSENSRNRNKDANKTTIYRGVDFHKITGKFRARITVNGVNKALGLFEDCIEAAKAYDSAAKELHGEFAHTNF